MISTNFETVAANAASTKQEITKPFIHSSTSSASVTSEAIIKNSNSYNTNSSSKMTNFSIAAIMNSESLVRPVSIDSTKLGNYSKLGFAPQVSPKDPSLDNEDVDVEQ